MGIHLCGVRCAHILMQFAEPLNSLCGHCLGPASSISLMKEIETNESQNPKGFG